MATPRRVGAPPPPEGPKQSSRPCRAGPREARRAPYGDGPTWPSLREDVVSDSLLAKWPLRHQTRQGKRICRSSNSCRETPSLSAEKLSI